LFIEDGGDVKIRLITKMHIVGTRRALKPLRQLFLSAFLTEIAEDGSFLFILMFILKDRGRLLALKANTIPQVVIFGKAFEAPNEYPSWYPTHTSLLLKVGK
jgi:hypothetical protein